MVVFVPEEQVTSCVCESNCKSVIKYLLVVLYTFKTKYLHYLSFHTFYVLSSPQTQILFMRYISVCCVVGIIAGFCIGPGELLNCPLKNLVIQMLKANTGF